MRIPLHGFGLEEELKYQTRDSYVRSRVTNQPDNPYSHLRDSQICVRNSTLLLELFKCETQTNIFSCSILNATISIIFYEKFEISDEVIFRLKFHNMNHNEQNIWYFALN